MVTVFAIWALGGFGYPDSAFPFAMNVISKLLAFVTVLTMFLPQRTQAQQQSRGTEQPEPQRTA